MAKGRGQRQRGEVRPYAKSFLVWPIASILLAACFAGASHNRALVPSANAQASQPEPQANPSSEPRKGEEIFASSCAGCHGLDGRGGERAPNIASRPSVQQLSDADLMRIIQQGIMGTGMPPFHSLQTPEIKAVVAYLRTLQGTANALKLPGNPERGKPLFFGTAGCSACHMANGDGGFIASDLSQFAGTHSAEQIRSAITNPIVDRQSRTAVATTRSGMKYTGRIRNEDNFSLQLQTLDGAFHFLLKSDLARLDYASQPLMPSNYSFSLKPDELNDLISYLMTLGKSNRSETDEEFDE